MHCLFQELSKEASHKGIKLQHIQDEVIDIEKRNYYEAATAKGHKFQFDFVMLCVGNTDSVDIFNLNTHSQYIHRPYPVSKISAIISKSHKVAIIGSSLTAVDIALSLRSKGHVGEIHMLSRKGELPSVRGIIKPYTLNFMTKAEIERLAVGNNGVLRLKDLLTLLRKELKNIGIKWREVIFPKLNSISSQCYFANEIIEECWHYLSDRDKNIFLNNYHTTWMAKRSPIPISNAKNIQMMLSLGQLKVKRDLCQITTHDKNNFIAFHKENQEMYNWVVNATGASRHIIESKRDSLINTLISKGYVKRNPYGGIQVDFTTASVIDRQNSPDFFMRAIGHITSGVYYYTSSFPMICRKAHHIAKQVAHAICQTKDVEKQLIDEDVNLELET